MYIKKIRIMMLEGFCRMGFTTNSTPHPYRCLVQLQIFYTLCICLVLIAFGDLEEIRVAARQLVSRSSAGFHDRHLVSRSPTRLLDRLLDFTIASWFLDRLSIILTGVLYTLTDVLLRYKYFIECTIVLSKNWWRSPVFWPLTSVLSSCRYADLCEIAQSLSQ